MYITRYTDYSLRVLMFLAVKGEDELSTIQEIADSYDISKNHLMKVVQELNNKQYLVAVRGKNGGLRLNGRPEDINIGVLVRDIEKDLILVECFNDETACVITRACHLKKLFSKALDAFLEVLDNHTLADLVPSAKRQTALAQLLHIAT
ncbi:MAG: DNA-binding protein [marine bacterium B5-7]|nr:MAG: DNA-binding protein [marine bacterium B5-7]